MSEPEPQRVSVGAVILAGGFGTRLRSVLSDVPKPMAPVAGRPFVEHVVRYLALHGVRDTVLATGYLSEVFSTHFSRHPTPGSRIRCVTEPRPMGTGGGFLYAVAACGFEADAWLVANGDSLVLANLEAFLLAFRQGDWDGAVLGLALDDAARFGSLEVGSDGALVRFTEKRPGAAVVNAGVYLFRSRLLEFFPRKEPLSFETEVFPAVIQQGARILVHRVQAPFLDIGTPESLAQAEAFIEQNRHLLHSGPLSFSS